MRAAGLEPPEEAPPPPPPPASPAVNQVVPQSVLSRQMANPFLAPDFSVAAARKSSRANRLANTIIFPSTIW